MYDVPFSAPISPIPPRNVRCPLFLPPFSCLVAPTGSDPELKVRRDLGVFHVAVLGSAILIQSINERIREMEQIG
jgi:hypothetical protein